MNWNRLTPLDLFGAGGTVATVTLTDYAGLVVALVTIAAMLPLAITRWRAFFRGDDRAGD